MTEPGVHSAEKVTISAARFDAVVFDMDGVVTDTAAVHRTAWARLFDEFLAAREGPAYASFTDDDYLRYVDGKARYDGVASFLASRGIQLSTGTPDDGPDVVTVCGLGNRKDEMFRRAVESGGVVAYPSTVTLVDRLHAAGLLVAVVSASRNATLVLSAAGLLDRFDVKVDGVDADRLGLPGKPDPAVFVTAVRRLGKARRRAVVVEDALAGVAAGHRGGFGLVIGVDRVGHAGELLAYGADVVVPDLAYVEVSGETP